MFPSSRGEDWGDPRPRSPSGRGSPVSPGPLARTAPWRALPAPAHAAGRLLCDAAFETARHFLCAFWYSRPLCLRIPRPSALPVTHSGCSGRSRGHPDVCSVVKITRAPRWAVAPGPVSAPTVHTCPFSCISVLFLGDFVVYSPRAQSRRSPGVPRCRRLGRAFGRKCVCQPSVLRPSDSAMG